VCSRAGVALLGYPVVDVKVRLVLHIDIEYLLLRSLPLIFQNALKSLEIVEKLSFGMKVELSNTNLEYSTNPRHCPVGQPQASPKYPGSYRDYLIGEFLISSPTSVALSSMDSTTPSYLAP
jgi:hypothetical protein